MHFLRKSDRSVGEKTVSDLAGKESKPDMKKIGIKALALCLCTAFLFSLVGCSGTEDEVQTQFGNGGTPIERDGSADDKFTLNYNPEMSFNPITGTNVDNMLFAPLLYESLFDVDETMTFHNKLCKSYETTDGVTYTITVDTSRKFHDGSNLTAKDVERSIAKAFSSVQYGERLNQNVLGIQATDTETLMVTLQKANMQFPVLMNIPIYKQDSEDADAPMGTGPYMLNEDRTQLVKFEDHPNSKSMPIDTIYLKQYSSADEIIAAFEGSYLDLVVNDPNGVHNLGYGNAIRKDYHTTSMHYIGFNMESAFMHYLPHRYMIGFLVNRTQIVTGIMGGAGTATTLPVLPVSPLYNHAYALSLDFSLEKAENILDAQGIKDYNYDGYRELEDSEEDGEWPELEIQFIVNNENASKVAAARDIAKNMETVGLRVNLRELAWDDYMTALQKKDFDMYYAEVKLTPDFDLTRLLTKKAPLNYGGISDENYATYINDYLKAADGSRQMYMDLMCKYIGETAPIIPIAFNKKQVMTHRDVVLGLNPTQYNIFYGIETWVIDLAGNAMRKEEETAPPAETIEVSPVIEETEKPKQPDASPKPEETEKAEQQQENETEPEETSSVTDPPEEDAS